MYLWRRLRRAISCEELPLDADALARLTTHDLARAFADDDGHVPLAPGIMDRLANLQDLGVRLSANWEGLFLRVVDAAAGSLERFAGLSADFRAFDDPVRKLTMVNAIMLTGSGLASFDRDPLPGVDYHLVKQVLRQGLVSPPSVLRHKLVVGELLEAQESLELRTAVLEALVQVADRAGMSTAFIDNLYWLNRRVCGEDHPSCSTCPFEAGCIQHTEIGLPLEMTRYY